jgi:hypothetical protein
MGRGMERGYEDCQGAAKINASGARHTRPNVAEYTRGAQGTRKSSGSLQLSVSASLIYLAEVRIRRKVRAISPLTGRHCVYR